MTESNAFSQRFEADSFFTRTTKSIQAMTKQVNLKVNAMGVSLDPNSYEEESLENCLISLEKAFPEPEETERTPVLFVDEANLLKILEDNGDHQVLDSFFRWIIRIVKEELPGKNHVQSSRKKLQIVMSSSDQFFLKWIQRKSSK